MLKRILSVFISLSVFVSCCIYFPISNLHFSELSANAVSSAQTLTSWHLRDASISDDGYAEVILELRNYTEPFRFSRAEVSIHCVDAPLYIVGVNPLLEDALVISSSESENLTIEPSIGDYITINGNEPIMSISFNSLSEGYDTAHVIMDILELTDPDGNTIILSGDEDYFEGSLASIPVNNQSLRATLHSAEADKTRCGDNIEWRADDRTVILTGTGEMWDYSSSLETPWGNERYSNYTSVEIGEGITSIGDNAFRSESFQNLEQITMPETLKRIGKNAFGTVGDLTYDNRLVLPDSLKIIDDEAFGACHNFHADRITLPSGLEYIGRGAFSNAMITGAVFLPSELQYIGINAFHCENPDHELFLPSADCIVDEAAIDRFGAYYGYSGSSLDKYCEEHAYRFVPLKGRINENQEYSVDLDSHILTITGEGNVDIYEEERPWDKLLNYLGSGYRTCYCENLVLGEGITNFNIPLDRFVSVRIPESMYGPMNGEFIGGQKYSIDKESRTLTITGSGDVNADMTVRPFDMLSSLVDSIIYGDGITSSDIPLNDFKKITLGKSYKEITVDTFGTTYYGYYSTNSCLEELTILNPDCEIFDSDKTISNGMVSEYNDYTGKLTEKYTFSGTIIGIKGSTAEEYANKYGRLFVDVESAAATTTASTAETTVTTVTTTSPSHLIEIVDSGNCSEFITYTFDSEGTLIISGTGIIPSYPFGDGAPWNAYKDSIKNVVFESGISGIGQGDFWGCSNIVSVSFPDTVISISAEAFYECKSLSSAVLPDNLEIIGQSAFMGCTELNLERIPNSVTSIGNYAFRECSSIEIISIPDGITAIPNGAFQDCSSLIPVIIPNTVTSIGNYAFSGCAMSSVDIPRSVTSIGAGAFQDCKDLRFVNIYGYIADIGGNAFKNTPWLEGRQHESGIVIINGILIDGTALSGAVKIPDSVIKIAPYAFDSCHSLTSVTIPDSVTIIGRGAFSNCTELTSVTIPASVISIGNCGFHYCEKMEEVTILNPDCDLSTGSVFTYSFNEPFTGIVRGYPGSTAEEYASKYNATFIALDSQEVSSTTNSTQAITTTTTAVPTTTTSVLKTTTTTAVPATTTTAPKTTTTTALPTTTTTVQITTVAQTQTSTSASQTTSTAPITTTVRGTTMFLGNKLTLKNVKTTVVSDEIISIEKVDEMSIIQAIDFGTVTLDTDDGDYIITVEEPKILLYINDQLITERSEFSYTAGMNLRFEISGVNDKFVDAAFLCDPDTKTVQPWDSVYSVPGTVIGNSVVFTFDTVPEKLKTEHLRGYLRCSHNGENIKRRNYDFNFPSIDLVKKGDGYSITAKTTNDLGDLNEDSKIDAKDASVILVYYAKVSTGGDGGLTERQKNAANINGDDKIDAKDASVLLSYYAYVSTASGDIPSLEEYLLS